MGGRGDHGRRAVRPTPPPRRSWVATSPCLDHGFVRVVDYMGDDAAIVQAARVSYGTGTRRVERGPRPDPLPHAAPPHDAVRDVRAEAPLQAADLRGAPVDPAPHGQRERVQRRATRSSTASSTCPRPSTRRRSRRANRQGRGETLVAERAARVLAAPHGATPPAATTHYEELLNERRRGPAAARRRARPRARARAHRPDAELLHAVVLEDRPAQPAALPLAARRSARAVRDPRLRRGDRRRRPALGAARLGGVRRLPARGHDAVARRARGRPAPARGRGASTSRRSGSRSASRTSCCEARADRARAMSDAGRAGASSRRASGSSTAGATSTRRRCGRRPGATAADDDRAFLEASCSSRAALHLRTRRGGTRGAEHLLSQALVTLEDYRPARARARRRGAGDGVRRLRRLGARRCARPHRFTDRLRIPRLTV